nr:hypothetical protein [Brevundimonas naejangsanensis]
MTAPMPETMSPREKVAEQTVGPVNYDRLRSVIHSATHAALPFAEAPMTIPFSTQERAALQAEIADLVISNLDKATVPIAALASSGDHAELARLAEAATPGEWGWDETCTPFYNDPDGRSCGGEATGFAEVVQDDDIDTVVVDRARLCDAAFIAAANPVTVLALIAEVAALRSSLKKANDGFEEYERKLYLEQDVREEAERRLAEAVEWRPIETAPRDGTEIIAMIARKRIRLAWYFKPSSRTEGWLDENGRSINPTHWLPLPPAPGAEA